MQIDSKVEGAASHSPTPTKKTLGFSPPPNIVRDHMNIFSTNENNNIKQQATGNISANNTTKATTSKNNSKKGTIFNRCFTPKLPEIKQDGELIGGAPACAANSSYTFPTDDGRKITLSSMFDSGNMAKAEQFNDNSYGVWTAPDCENTEHVTGYRTWFHFAVRGFKKGNTIKFTIMNMNKQTGLFQHDHRPSVSSSPSAPKWKRLPVPVSKHTIREGNIFEVEFKHTFLYNDEEVRFAFCFPYSYTEVQERFEYLDRVFSNLPFDHMKGMVVPPKPSNDGDGKNNSSNKAIKKRRGPLPETKMVSTNGIYYHREVLTRSMDGRRLDLITITSSDNFDPNQPREEKFDGYFTEVNPGNSNGAKGSGGDGQRAHRFGNRPIVFFSARVHPGETPAQWVLEGVVRFLLRDSNCDPRAAALRNNFVFKIIPILNPDGVARGHYRADTLGVNLNRTYQFPTRQREPTIHAAKTTVMKYFGEDRLQLYVDLHAHASKRGVFIYGNRCDGLETQIENMLLVRLMTLNTRWLDFDACNFSEKNMKAKDRRDKGASKEGSGRVAVYHATNNTFAHSYTLECNYNTGRSTNQIPEASMGRGRASPSHLSRQNCPKYTDETFTDVGKGVLLGLLDFKSLNPWSRLNHSLWHNIEQARQGIFKRLRHSAPYREEAKQYKDAQKRTGKNDKKSRKNSSKINNNFMNAGSSRDKVLVSKKSNASKKSSGKVNKKSSNIASRIPKASASDSVISRLKIKKNVIASSNGQIRLQTSPRAYPINKMPANVTNITFGTKGLGIGEDLSRNQQLIGPYNTGRSSSSSEIIGRGPRARNGLAHLQQKNVGIGRSFQSNLNVKVQRSKIPVRNNGSR
jgi:cytosolic carboxypeptidase protein 5